MLPSIEFTADSSVSLSIVLGIIDFSHIKDKKKGKNKSPPDEAISAPFIKR